MWVSLQDESLKVEAFISVKCGGGGPNEDQHWTDFERSHRKCGWWTSDGMHTLLGT